MLLIFHGYPMQEVAPCSENRTGCWASLVLFPQPLLIRFIKFCFYYTTYYITLYIFCQVAKFFFALTLKTFLTLFIRTFQVRGCSMLLFCLPRKVTKRVHLRTTFLRISLTCRFKRAAARVRVEMLLHLTWNAFSSRKVVSFDTVNMAL